MSDITGSPSIYHLSLTIRDIDALYQAYIPFIKHGGLFIPTSKHYKIDDRISIQLTLLSEIEEITFSGKVIWITPESAHNRNPGVGVQFESSNDDVRTKIETYLADRLNSEKPTYTM
ncbi:PilZ domain-containing protein [Candidatus Nitrosacidococcus tergens]|uniref:Type 4 fimbrial biogenesis protein PilZ n=1 Tax=Candidatus Nitrosacidococcus tergens TaxID=553981 RepID=A0A7G1Q9D3_9GAMM|nr:PilZ domain-containing protein [Candidatus Nitrosacidococcus tergens]CAB1275919.1 Type 4 fimbrial biogenesis protein PilZ [Candidatus Nitrosacidococcus tergens]